MRVNRILLGFATFTANVGLGAVAGVLWWLVAPTAPVRVTQTTEYAMTDPELLIGQEGWFAVIAAAGGVLTALLVCWRSDRAPTTRLVAGLLGAIAAALIASYLGGVLGPPPITDELRESQGVAESPLALRTMLTVLVWPGVAASCCAIYLSIVDWSDAIRRA